MVAPTWLLMSSPISGRPRSCEPLSPIRSGGDEHRDAVDEGAAGLQRALGIPFGRPLGTDGQVGDKNIGCRAAERFGDIVDRVVRLLDDIREVPAEPVEGRAARHGDARSAPRLRSGGCCWGAHRSPRPRRGRPCSARRRRRGYLDVADMIAAELDVHQAGDVLVALGVAIVADTLDERGGAVADTDDADPNFFGSHSPAVPARQT